MLIEWKLFVMSFLVECMRLHMTGSMAASNAGGSKVAWPVPYPRLSYRPDHFGSRGQTLQEVLLRC